MLNFTYYNPVKILFGRGKIAALSTEIASDRRILMVYGQGSIKKNGVYDQVKAALKDHTVFEFSGVEANPHYETLMKAVEMIRREKINFVLAVGGGSVLDGVKFIVAAAEFEGDPLDIISKITPLKSAVPFGTVLTLAATGSEMNDGGVVTREETHEKFPFRDPHLFPQFSILDPETTFSVSKRQTINGIVDAYVHVVEQYINGPLNAPLQDRMAESILLTLMEEGPKALKNPNDYEARANVMFCAMMALNGMFSMGLSEDWETHLIGHELTAFYGMDHAQTLAVLLPAVWRARKKEKREKLLQYGARVFNIGEGNEEVRLQNIINATETFFQSLGMKTRLHDYSLDEAIIPTVVKGFLKHKSLMMPHRAEVNAESTESILRDCL